MSCAAKVSCACKLGRTRYWFNSNQSSVRRLAKTGESWFVTRMRAHQKIEKYRWTICWCTSYRIELYGRGTSKICWTSCRFGAYFWRTLLTPWIKFPGRFSCAGHQNCAVNSGPKSKRNSGILVFWCSRTKINSIITFFAK